MRKSFIVGIILLMSMPKMFSQNIFDMSGLNTSHISGTARYMSMAGSFGALGGDASAIWDNPATLGIFRSNELGFSISYKPTRANSLFNSVKTTGVTSGLQFNNFTWVLNLPSAREVGYLASNFSFGFNRLHSFNRTYGVGGQIDHSLTDLMVDITNGLTSSQLAHTDSYEPYNNQNVSFLSILGYQGYLIDPTDEDPATTTWVSALAGKPKMDFQSVERGYVDGYKFAYSGNVNDMLYFGLGLSLENYYKEIQTRYVEDFSPDKFALYNRTYTSGVGFNLAFGLIWRATDFMRLGASVATPTYYRFKSTQMADLSSSLGTGVLQSPEVTTSYKYHSPFNAQFSAGFIIGKRAALNVDYGLAVGKTQKIKGYSDYAFFQEFAIENEAVTKFARTSHTVKFGGELRVGKRTKLRGGFAYISSPIKPEANRDFLVNTTRTDMEYLIDASQIFGTCGVGFTFNNIFLDFAYVYNRQNQVFTPFEMYDQNFKADITTNRHNIVGTLIWKY